MDLPSSALQAASDRYCCSAAFGRLKLDTEGRLTTRSGPSYLDFPLREA